MEAFLRTVDAAAPSNLAAIIAGLAAGGFIEPLHLVRADSVEVLESFPTEGNDKLLPAGKAFVRRAIDAAGTAAAVTAIAPVSVPLPVPRPEHLAELFGSQVSAESVAAAMAGETATVNVHDLLSKVNLASLPSAMLADMPVWQAMAADSKAAEKKGKTTFTFVDFTARAMLPPWLPADAVGGKKQQDHAPELDPGAGTSSLQALSCALQAAVAEPREIRTFSQWVSIYARYAPMAIAVKQLTPAMAYGYLATISKLFEMERLQRVLGFVALKYDVALRKSWAKRCQQNDPDLDIEKECYKLNEDMLEEVRAQVAGAQARQKALAGQAASSDKPRSLWADAAAEGALAKVGAAANAMTKRAEAASRELLKAEQSLTSREKAMKGEKRQHQNQGEKRKANWSQKWSGNKAGGGGRGAKRHFGNW